MIARGMIGATGKYLANIPSDNLQLWLNANDFSSIRSNGAADFNGTNQSLSIADNPSLSMGDVEFEGGGWFRLDTLPPLNTEMGLMGKWQSGDLEYLLFVDDVSTTKRFKFRVRDTADSTTTTVTASTLGTPLINQWYFITFYHNATNDEIGIGVNDGTYDTAATTGGVRDGTADFVVGSHSGGNYFDGKADSLFARKEILTSAERAWKFNNGKGRDYQETGNANNDGADLRTNMVSWWECDEVFGIRVDSHGSNDLVSNNGVTNAAGVAKRAIDCITQNNEYLAVPHHTSLDTGNIDFTIGCWVYLTDLIGSQEIFTKHNNTSTAREYRLQFNHVANRFRFGVSSTGTNQTIIDANNLGQPVAQQWYFILCWHDATNDTLNIQVNNRTVDSVAYSAGVFVTSQGLGFGAFSNGGTSINGRIHSPFFMKRIPTATERTYLYNYSLGVTYADIGEIGTAGANLKTNLISWWPFSEISGGTVAVTRNDVHGANHATDNNTVASAESNQRLAGEAIEDNTSMVRFIDKTANRFDFVETVGSRQPSYQTNEINGRPAVQFDGIDDKMVGVDDGLDVGTGDFTICGVIRRNNNLAEEAIFSKQTGSTAGYGVFLSVSGRIGGRVHNGTTAITSIDDGTVIDNGLPHVFIVVFDRDGNMARYIDGTASGTADSIASQSANSYNNSLQIRLGIRADGTSNPFGGFFAEGAIYFKAFTAQEIDDYSNYAKAKWGIV